MGKISPWPALDCHCNRGVLAATSDCRESHDEGTELLSHQRDYVVYRPKPFYFGACHDQNLDIVAIKCLTNDVISCCALLCVARYPTRRDENAEFESSCAHLCNEARNRGAVHWSGPVLAFEDEIVR